MKTATMTLVIALVAAPVAAQTAYVSPDVPTDPGTGWWLGPWDVVEHGGGTYAAAPSLSLPALGALDAVHKMDAPGHWLFSLEAPSDLGGALSATAEPRDVLRDDGSGSYQFYFCGGAVVDPVPLSSDVDAAFQETDDGDLILSFDVPTTIAGTTFDPADLVRYERTVFPGTCADWQLVGIDFDASLSGGGILTHTNVIGADRVGGDTIVVLDIPTDLVPTSGPLTYLPGHVTSWDGATFGLHDSLTSWPLSSEVDALSCQANPGEVLELQVDKSAVTPGDLTLTWTPSCASGAEDYGIYEGQLGVWYSHAWIDCFDDLGDLTEEITPAATDRYFLVVPWNSTEEGSYSTRNDAGVLIQRPQPGAVGDRCVVTQKVVACP